MSAEQQQVLLAVAVPATIAVVLLLVGWRPWRTGSAPRTGPVASPLAAGAGIIVADLAVRGWHGIAPASTAHWMIHLAAAGAILGWTMPAWHKPAALRLSVLVLASAAAAFALVRFRVLSTGFWTPSESVAWLGALTAVIAIPWIALDRLAVRANGASLPILLWATASGSAACLLLGAAESALALLAGAAAATLGAFVLLAWWRPALPALRPAIPVISLVVPGLLVLAIPKSDDALPRYAAALLLAAAPVAGWLRVLPPLSWARPWIGTLASFLIAAAMIGWAVVIAERQFIPFDSP